MRRNGSDAMFESQAARSIDRISLKAELGEAVIELCRFVEKRRFQGFDPYDALNSPVLRAVSLGQKWPRIAVTQIIRRSPVNLRPLLGIRPGSNPKGLGLFLSSYVRLHEMTGESHYADVCQQLRERIVGAVCRGYSGACWGYNFPWQSRAFYLPRGTPTVVNTSFIGQALLDLHESSGDPEALKLAESACVFVCRDLNRHVSDKGECFSYTPLDQTRVHNANALAAAFLARTGYLSGNESFQEQARACARYLLAHQRDDGSWYYADASFQQWIDSFHTGFVLDSLTDVARYAGFQEGSIAVERGFRFFLRSFFEPDGAVRYYHDSLQPVDVHCPTQAMVTLAKAWPRAPEPDLLRGVVSWFLREMRAPEGYFYFRIRRSGKPNRIPYMRWGQAWALHALTAVARLLSEERTIALRGQ